VKKPRRKGHRPRPPSVLFSTEVSLVCIANTSVLTSSLDGVSEGQFRHVLERGKVSRIRLVICEPTLHFRATAYQEFVFPIAPNNGGNLLTFSFQMRVRSSISSPP